jgi:hypothetical protein
MNKLELRRRLAIQNQITKIDIGTHVLGEGLRSILNDLNPILKAEALELRRRIIMLRENVYSSLGREIGIN